MLHTNKKDKPINTLPQDRLNYMKKAQYIMPNIYDVLRQAGHILNLYMPEVLFVRSYFFNIFCDEPSS
ncbi:unknown [Prevotella sp. CAG:1185]|nr:unknown [Prevotella sp. CAG:1185]